MRKSKRFYVSGMHCRSCELLIEDKISESKDIISSKAMASKGEVVVEYRHDPPSANYLNDLFSKEGYGFSEKPIIKRSGGILIKGALIAALVAGVFWVLGKMGFGGLASVSSDSSFISFLTLGLIAGFSACAALVGGLVISLSNSWESGLDNESLPAKARPHVAFNAGRLVSYAFFGAILGLLGEKLNFSPVATAIIISAASIVMAVSGLKMIGVRTPSLAVGKKFFRSIFKKADNAKKYAPFISGFLTFFLPCGFTISAQSAALASGSPLRGGIMMFFFALGTAPSLFMIGMSKSGLAGNNKRGAIFSAAAGFLLLLFAVFNVNSQLNVLGLKSLSDVNKVNSVAAKPDSKSGKQIIKMDASASGYSPNYFEVEVGRPVRWEIADRGTSGCTNAIIARGLVKGQIPLKPGSTTIVEFTPKTPGTYKFSCWMGMIQGTIKVK